jgi:DNA-directed RNA polymerase specialized sigma24 family protein
MPTEAKTSADLSAENHEMIDLIYARCHENAPNFGVTLDCFKDSVSRTIFKYLGSDGQPDAGDVDSLLAQIQADDLFLALACANGNERAWWEFDQAHRSYLERVARHLAKTEVDAQEVIDQVYVELYGTKIVDGERVSKFSTYSGRGSLRGWLRTVIWHSLVDLHRASHDEVSLDEMTENVGEGMAHASFAETARAAVRGRDDRPTSRVNAIARRRSRHWSRLFRRLKITKSFYCSFITLRTLSCVRSPAC